MKCVKKSGKLIFMNSKEKSIIVASAACATTNAQGGAVCLDGKQGISTAWEILDCSAHFLVTGRAGKYG